MTKHEDDNDFALLSVHRAAKLLKVGSARIYKLIENGELGFIRFDERSIRIPRTELKRWIESKTTFGARAPNPPPGSLRRERVCFDAKAILDNYRKNSRLK